MPTLRISSAILRLTTSRGEVPRTVAELHHRVPCPLRIRRLPAQRLRGEGRGSLESWIAVGWNCTNSRSATSAPARIAGGEAVAGAHRRARRLREEAAEAAGGEHDRPSEEGLDTSLDEDEGATDLSLRARQEVDEESLLDEVDPVGKRRLGEAADQLTAG